MKIATRLRLGNGLLSILLLVAAGGAAGGFYDLGRVLKQGMQAGQAGGNAGMELLQNLERQYQAAVSWILDPSSDRLGLLRSDPALLVPLKALQAAATEGERPKVVALEEELGKYRAALERLVLGPLDRLLSSFEAEVLPPLHSARRLALELLSSRQNALLASQEAARDATLLGGAWLGALAIVALVLVVWLLRWQEQAVLGRLDELRRVAGVITGGDERRRLPVPAEDELGLLARRFNEVLDARDALRKEAEGLQSQERQLLLGLLSILPEGAALFRLDGRLVAGSDPIASVVAGWLENQGQQILRSYSSGPAPVAVVRVPDRGDFRVRLLLVEGRRPVGWVALKPAETTG